MFIYLIVHLQLCNFFNLTKYGKPVWKEAKDFMLCLLYLQLLGQENKREMLL